jgi:hypothetical protein
MAQPGAQALERELAIAGLAAGVLGDRADDRTATRHDARLLRLGQRIRGVDVEHGLHTRRRDVRMLTTGTRGTAGTQGDLAEGERDVTIDPHRVFHAHYPVRQ